MASPRCDIFKPSLMADRSSSAEGQYLGYSLQLGRLLALLLEGRESTAVTLEHLGDVSVETEGSLSRIEEHKSRTSRANPISDRAIDLWKTLRNWMDLVKGGLDPDETEFHLHINRYSPSNFATKFHNASDPSEFHDLVSDVVEFFDKEPPGEILGKFVGPVLDQSRRTTLYKILQAFQLSPRIGEFQGRFTRSPPAYGCPGRTFNGRAAITPWMAQARDRHSARAE